jgi:hypothetical protein
MEQHAVAVGVQLESVKPLYIQQKRCQFAAPKYPVFILCSCVQVFVCESAGVGKFLVTAGAPTREPGHVVGLHARLAAHDGPHQYSKWAARAWPGPSPIWPGPMRLGTM